MEEVTGVLKTLGESTTIMAKKNSGSVYTYIEIGDRHITSLMVTQGINGTLASSLEVGEPVTLYITKSPLRKYTFLYAIKRSDGRIYAANMGGFGQSKSFLVFLSVLGVLAIPLFGLGLLMLGLVFQLWPYAVARDAARDIPGAILI